MRNISDEKWVCDICGASSFDYDERENTLESHLRQQHELSFEQYCALIEEEQIGSSHLRVKILNYPNDIKLAIVSFLSQTWGPTFSLENFTQEEICEMMAIALEGKSLTTALECINFTFQIDGLSRASSHQLVRVRIGSGFSQKGMSDAYYGDAQYVTPASIVAAGKTSEYEKAIKSAIKIYDELFKAGVPYQDARFVLPHAMTTSLVWSVNYLALKNFCAKRMMRNQSWEMNMLCQLIKKELYNIYPELAVGLVPMCEFSHKCQSFGNLYEGCGKFPLDKKHDRYVFSARQIAYNMKFTEEYKSFCKEHNKYVNHTNNHFLLMARERINKIEEFKEYQNTGLYDNAVYKAINECQIKEQPTDDLVNQIIESFKSIYRRFQKYENGDSDFIKDFNKVIDFNNCAFTLIAIVLKKRANDIKVEICNLFKRKNGEYNDGWHYDGIRGIIKDLHRKVYRLISYCENNTILGVDVQDTLYDILLYGIFLYVAYEKDLPLKKEFT